MEERQFLSLLRQLQDDLAKSNREMADASANFANRLALFQTAAQAGDEKQAEILREQIHTYIDVSCDACMAITKRANDLRAKVRAG